MGLQRLSVIVQKFYTGFGKIAGFWVKLGDDFTGVSGFSRWRCGEKAKQLVLGFLPLGQTFARSPTDHVSRQKTHVLTIRWFYPSAQSYTSLPSEKSCPRKWTRFPRLFDKFQIQKVYSCIVFRQTQTRNLHSRPALCASRGHLSTFLQRQWHPCCCLALDFRRSLGKISETNKLPLGSINEIYGAWNTHARWKLEIALREEKKS